MRRVPWATVGLVVLAVVALVLVFGALRSTSPTATPRPSASALTTPSATDTPSEDADGRDDVDDALPPVVEPPLLLADPDVAYRGTTGSCLGGASLERTTDGGRSWKEVEVPAATILGLSGTAGAPLQLVGADDDCTLQQWTSSDGGRSWSGPTPATGVFSRLPDTAREIATPSGVQPNPCPGRGIAPVSVEQISESAAAVLCDGGVVLTTVDGGVAWSEVATVSGAQALAFDGTDVGWVLVRDSGVCPGYQIQRSTDGGRGWEQLGGCVGETALPDERSRPSLSFLDAALGMADLAGETFVTVDEGLNWYPPKQ